MNQFAKAYKDYCEFAKSEYIDYYTLTRWASKFDIDCFIIFYPDGFHYEVEYHEGRISGPPCEIIIDTIEQISEAVFSIVEESFDDVDIFDELSVMRDYSDFLPDNMDDGDKLKDELLKKGLESCEEMVQAMSDGLKFREKFLDMVMFLSAYINIDERKICKEDSGETGNDCLQ